MEARYQPFSDVERPKHSVVKEVDLEAGVIRVEIPEGLIDDED